MLLQHMPRRAAYLQAMPCKLALGREAATIHTSARRQDHYRTLEVPKGASQQDIKAQFYKLSKKWHPDVNPDSENANQKFQQVSEAYATLGSESNRKDYDRQLGSSRHGAPRGANRGQFRYASENVARRATASYAWDYQQRRSPPRGASSSHSGQANGKYHEFGKNGSSSAFSPGHSSMFEKFAERERKREAATAARMGEAGKTSSTSAFISREEHEAQTASPLIRFCQVAGLFYVIFYLGTKLGSGGESKENKKSKQQSN